MYKKEATVKSVIGLHARPASLLVKLAGKYKSKIILHSNGKQINARSMFDVLGAGVKGGSSVVVEAEGEDEISAVEAVAELIETIEN